MGKYKYSKILLVNPPYTIKEYMGKLGEISVTFPPVALLYLASFMRRRNYDVKIFDFQVESNFVEVFRKFIPDYVGITCSTALVYTTLELAKIIKSMRNIPVVVGGVHPTFRPQDLIEDENIDFVVKGEGEITFYELIKGIENGNNFSFIKGLVTKEGENKDRPMLEDLDYLGFPAIDLIHVDKYKLSPDLYFGKKMALLSTSRGCPFDCLFCASKVIFHRKIRYRKLEDIFKEIDYYINQHNIDFLFIMDDCFTLHKNRLIEFCEHMIKKYKGKILWWAQTRADKVNPEILVLMKRAGCRVLSFGVETGVDRLLKVIRKDIDLLQVKRAIKMVKKAGISPRGSFIIGLPTETLLDTLKTIWFALTGGFDRIKIGLATPFPGTDLWTLAKKEGKIEDIENWNRFTAFAGYTHHRVPYLPDNRHNWELRFLQQAGNLLFFLKPSIAFGMLKTYTQLGARDKLFNSVKVYFNTMFSKK